MTKRVKAVLLSALLFPGLGQFFLKKYVSAAIFAGAAIVALYVILDRTVEMAQQIVDKIQAGEIPADVQTMTAMVTAQASGSDAQAANVASFVLLIAWLVGIIDAYRAGDAQDKKDTEN